jgi:hypothetical protein
VAALKVQQSGTSVSVNITMRDLEYETCKPVYAKELEFYEQFPSYDFDFDVTLAA